MREGKREPTEIEICQAWHHQAFQRHALQTVDGRPLTVVYPGRWTYNFGPDFQGALIAFGAELRQGAVEVHRRSSGWLAHGHDRDPAYNAVILHVVLEHDLPTAARKANGASLDTLVVSLDEVRRDGASAASLPPLDGAFPCVAEVTVENHRAVLTALERVGDTRLAAKAAGIETWFTVEPPGQVLYAGLLDALGYSRNREPMARLAALVTLEELERRLVSLSEVDAWRRAVALLLGVAGLLSLDAATGLAPEDEAAIGAVWAALAPTWAGRALTRADWTLARTRPANHPARRLLGMAALLARTRRRGLVAALREAVSQDDPALALREVRRLLLGPDAGAEQRYIGVDRAGEIAINVLVPFCLAYGAWVGDEPLLAGAAALWERHPAPALSGPLRDFVAQLGGGRALRLRTGRQAQGALHLYKQLCQHRRCFECPLAALARQTARPEGTSALSAAGGVRGGQGEVSVGSPDSAPPSAR